ncbi:hypothetical protein ACU8KH_04984 [Lachancea thermotolerans]
MSSFKRAQSSDYTNALKLPFKLMNSCRNSSMEKKVKSSCLCVHAVLHESFKS